ncbi:Smr/MutS family protein [Syntrophomonas erecta]
MKIEKIDLHGLNLEEARLRLEKNLAWCMKNQVDVLDINHGKGHHSERGFSVIKKEVRNTLQSHSKLKEMGYRIVYGESSLPVALTYDEGHTLVVKKGQENKYLGGSHQQQKNWEVFSDEARRKRKQDKKIRAQKQNRRSPRHR